MAAFLAVTAGGVLAIGWLIGFGDERVPVAVACAPGVGMAGAARRGESGTSRGRVVQWMVLSLYVVGIVNALAVPLGSDLAEHREREGHGVWLGISSAGLGPLAPSPLIDPGSPDEFRPPSRREGMFRLRILGFPFLVLLLAIVLCSWRTGPWEKGAVGSSIVAIGEEPPRSSLNEGRSR